jgi:membrane-associated phospholipid phosphatase
MSFGWKRPLVLAGVCWIAFAAVLAVAYWLPFGRWADGWAVEGFLNLQRPWLNDIAQPVAKLADPGPFAILTALLAGVALWRRRPRHALAVLLLLGGANLVTQTLKVVLAHPRPHPFLKHAQLGVDAFPSGHATASMALACAAVLVAPHAWRPLVAAVGALFALAVSESIMLLGWHFPSDVAGGFLVATSCALVTLAALRAAEQRWPERTGREAAKRALADADGRRIAVAAVCLIAVAGAVVAIAAGGRTLHYADRHTTAVAAALVVAAMSAVLPASLVALGARQR